MVGLSQSAMKFHVRHRLAEKMIWRHFRFIKSRIVQKRCYIGQKLQLTTIRKSGLVFIIRLNILPPTPISWEIGTSLRNVWIIADVAFNIHHRIIGLLRDRITRSEMRCPFLLEKQQILMYKLLSLKHKLRTTDITPIKQQRSKLCKMYILHWANR